MFQRALSTALQSFLEVQTGMSKKELRLILLTHGGVEIAFQRQNLVGHLAKNLMGLLVEKYDEIVKKIDTP